jgi:nucleotide-binding universal stress UspA family protein
MNNYIRKILLCVDNSELSHEATGATVTLSKALQCQVIGVHGYNARMHEGAFRIMEPIIPSKYQDEALLSKQRKGHKKLINMGLESISQTYIKPIEELLNAEGIENRSIVREGKNFKVINEIIHEEKPELVIMGSSGFNAAKEGFIGSVCLRVLRDNNRNFLIVKRPVRFKKFVVCLDGSSSAIDTLRIADLLSEHFNSELHLIYVFDVELHRALFRKLKDSVARLEGFNFNSEEQERIHDEFIDKGLEHVGSMIIDRAVQECNISIPDNLEGWGPAVQRRVFRKVMAGHIYKTICDYAKDIEADVVFLGRTGRHFVKGIDIGSVAENVVRFSPCSVFITMHKEFKGWEI